MNKLKKRATALLLGAVTFFMALAMPYNTTRVYAADVAFSWVVNESSNTILNWILLYLGISVAPEAISEGKVFDKTGKFALDFCNEFFGDTWDQWCVQNGFDSAKFKDDFLKCINQDADFYKDIAGSINGDLLDTLYSYLIANSNIRLNDMSNCKPLEVGVKSSVNFDFSCKLGYDSSVTHCKRTYSVELKSCSSAVYPLFVFSCNSSGAYIFKVLLCSSDPFETVSGKAYLNSLGFYLYDFDGGDYRRATDFNITSNIPYYSVSSSLISLYGLSDGIYQSIKEFLDGVYHPDIDIPDVAGKDYAYDLVGWPNAWDVDKPDVKPWDGVDSLPIPGDVVLGDSIPGVIDFPDVIQKIIDGTIPWPDVIGAVRDIDIPAPDPDPDEPDKKPEPDPELPEIPAVLPQGVSDKLKDLSGKFPFCIPFDLVDCFKSFGSNEAAEAPKWDFTFKIPGTNKDYEFSVDLSMFDKYIPIFRSGVLILFLIGLILGTRKLIGWQVKN